MSKKKDIATNSRREFIKKSAKLGLLSFVGISSLSSFLPRILSSPRSKVLTAEGKVIELSNSEIERAKIPLDKSTSSHSKNRQGIAGKHWVMVVDLAKCKNARLCMNACQSAHHLKPEQHHINVLQTQETAQSTPTYMPKPCMQCDEPPCTKVCPVDATFKRNDGIVLIDNERCIGCRFCVAACPYSARVFNWTETLDEKNNNRQAYDIELNVPQKKGTISKCLFSADQLRKQQLPYCVSSCPNGVYWFGDLNEDAVTNGTTKETVRFSQLTQSRNAYTLMPELGTKPNVYYLPNQKK